MTYNTTAHHDADKATREDVWEMAADLGTPFLVTLGNDGPHARPMYPIVRPEEGLIWFLTDRRSEKEDEIGTGAQATLAFGNGSNQYLTMVGGDGRRG